jgi:uncharacterized membrane protein (Fun14 family)
VGVSSDLSVGDLLFSTGGGFLFGAIAGYAIRKVMKIAAVVTGLFVAGLAYLSYKGWIDIKWMEMENATRATLTSVEGQVAYALNNTTSQFATQASANTSNGTMNIRPNIQTDFNPNVTSPKISKIVYVGCNIGWIISIICKRTGLYIYLLVNSSI